MSKLPRCPSCEAVVARSHARCPYCAVTLSSRISDAARWALRGAALLGGSALLGCAYGLPEVSCELPDGGSQLGHGVCPDLDGGK